MKLPRNEDGPGPVIGAGTPPEVDKKRQLTLIMGKFAVNASIAFAKLTA